MILVLKFFFGPKKIDRFINEFLAGELLSAMNIFGPRKIWAGIFACQPNPLVG